MPKLKAIEQLAAWKERFPAPCQAACPVHTDVRSYVTLSGQREFGEAFRTVTRPNAVASVCGRACSAPCEDVCTRGEFGRPVRIRQLKRFLTDRYLPRAASSARRPATGLKVSIVGAGPAGLAAARDLALMGHAVTIYEGAPEAGGMAILGVPRFRLSREAVVRDIEAIEDLGVEIKTGVRVGTDVALSGLREESHALFIAAGAMRPNVPNLENMHLEGVVQALPFLEEANLGGRPPCGKRVAVLGGGYTAMDAARTAVRLGAEQVTVLYRRTRAETEVHDEELLETLNEGVTIEYLVSPLRLIEGMDGRVTGVQLVRNRLGEPDASGRPRPVAIEGSEFVFDADMVVMALGQAPDPEDVDSALAAAISRVQGDDLMTEVPGVFAGGDFITGPSTIIEAAAHGRAAAAAIHRYLGEAFAPGEPWPPIEDMEVDLVENELLPVVDASGMALDVEVEQTLSESEAALEGLRCLFCGLLPVIKPEKCTACQDCALICPVECISRVALQSDGTTRPDPSGPDVLVYEIDSEACIRCGRCFKVCPTGAIVVDGFEWD